MHDLDREAMNKFYKSSSSNADEVTRVRTDFIYKCTSFKVISIQLHYNTVNIWFECSETNEGFDFPPIIQEDSSSQGEWFNPLNFNMLILFLLQLVVWMCCIFKLPPQKISSNSIYSFLKCWWIKEFYWPKKNLFLLVEKIISYS